MGVRLFKLAQKTCLRLKVFVVFKTYGWSRPQVPKLPDIPRQYWVLQVSEILRPAPNQGQFLVNCPFSTSKVT